MDETQNDAPFVAFYDMHAVKFVPPDEMADLLMKESPSRQKSQFWTINGMNGSMAKSRTSTRLTKSVIKK